MRKISELKEVHQILFEMSKVFHKICVDNDIPYYMAYGTMLGAIRHKGFIPWDDDMDFAIEYKYYQKLVDVLRKELPEPYKLLTRYDIGGAAGGYLKIVNTTTIVKEDNKLIENENTGLFIDVFLLYNAPESTFSFRYFVIRLLLIIQHFRFYRIHSNLLWKSIVESVIKTLFAGLKMHQIYDFLEAKVFPRKSCCFTSYASTYGKRDFVPKIYFGNPKLYIFKDTELYGVENPDAYLKQMYGNYMQMPPVEKRNIHFQDAYYL